MADIKVRLELNENANEESIGTVKTDNLTFANTSIEPNAAGVFNNMPTRDNTTKGINALTFGQELYFNENGMLDNVDDYGGGLDSENNKFEIVWGVVNPDNTYNVKITFENSVDLKDIIIYGDKESKQFPTRAILDDTTEVFSDDYIWTLQFPSESNTHTIEFTHWNRANYNAVLTFIGVMLKYIEIDKRNGLKSVESLSQSTGQPKEIFYGVVPSSGYIEVVDVNGEIADMVRDGVIPNSSVNVEISANGNIVQKHISEDSEYNNNSRMYKVDVGNKLDDWDKLTYLGRELTDKKNAYELLLEILSGLGFNNANEIDNMVSDYVIYNGNKYSIKEYLQKIIISYPYLSSSTYREAIDKVCNLAQLQVLYSDNGMPKFVSARPIVLKNDTIIKIPSKSIIGNFDKTFILKNKYDGIDISIARINTNESVHTTAYEKSFYNFTENLSTTEDYDTAMDNHGTAGGYYFTFALMKNTYIDISFYISRFSNRKLKEITNLYDGVSVDESGTEYENITYTMEYSKETGTASANATYNGIYTNPSVVNTSYQTFDKFSGKINADSFTHKFGSASTTVRANDISNITQSGIITTYDNQYEIKNLKILVGKELIGVGADASFTNIDDESIAWNGNCTLYKATKLTISINGDVKEILFDYVDDNSPNIENAKTIAKIPQSEILQSGTNIDGISLSSIIKENIFNDYCNGIADGKLSVVCSDYYDINGNKIKDWSLGQVLEVGDVVKIDKDNNGNSAMKYADGSDMYFRITGRKFRYAGVPLLDLELQEVKQIILAPIITAKRFIHDSRTATRITITHDNIDAKIYYSLGTGDYVEYTGAFDLISSNPVITPINSYVMVGQHKSEVSSIILIYGFIQD